MINCSVGSLQTAELKHDKWSLLKPGAIKFHLKDNISNFCHQQQHNSEGLGCGNAYNESPHHNHQAGVKRSATFI